MFRTILAAATAIPLLLGLAASAAAEDSAPEPPRNRLSPTDDTELPQRTTPPLAPPRPLIQRRVSEPHATEPPAPPRAPPPEAKAPQAKPQAPAKRRVVAQRLVTKLAKPARIASRKTAPPRRAVAARTYQQDDTSLGALFTAGRTPPRSSPEAAPRTLTYNYFGTSPAWRDDDDAPCPTRSRTSLSALFACGR